MEKIALKSVYFNKLKGLSNVNISFSRGLTAIMGVNGVGKTTVIHALACLYQPDGRGENHKFPEFFIPNTDALWKGSELNVVNEIEDDTGKRLVLPSRRYSKNFDRWSPRYENRPKRNVYYLGIDTCLPDIEKRTTTSRIMYKSKSLADKQSQKVIENSAYILNKEYNYLIDNLYKQSHFMGVELKSGLKYSALSMGSGEQRIIKIISVMLNAEAYSLVLIDEVDLLLHISALRRLLEVVNKIALKKHIQVVFTTHSLEVIKMTNIISIQYIVNTRETEQTLVFEQITPDLIFNMTGQTCKTLCIYVEDYLAKQIIVHLIRKNNMSSSVKVVHFGAIENAFTLAASFVLRGEKLDNILIVTDGDRYRHKEEKEKQIEKKLSGSEEDAKIKRESALTILSEFILPERCSPEQFLHDVIIRCFDRADEIYVAADEINAVCDKHGWIDNICDKLGLNLSDIVSEIYNHAKEDQLFNEYIKPVNNWLLAHKK